MAADPRTTATDTPPPLLARRGGVVRLPGPAGSGGVLLHGLLPAEVELLSSLPEGFGGAELVAAARSREVPSGRTLELLALLRRHGLAAPGRGARRDRWGDTALADRSVVVGGAHGLTSAVGRLLTRAGVGRVEAGPWAADTADATLRGSRAAPRPDLVVLVADRLDPRAAEAWRRRGTTHLPVVATADRVTVGPVVTADPDGPCTGCVARTRSGPGGRRDDGPVGAWDEALGTLAAGVTVMVARAALLGDPLPRGVSVEAAGPWPQVQHRRWERHPECPHHGAPGGHRGADEDPGVDPRASG